MTAAALIHWWCLTCPATGAYEDPQTKTDTGPAVAHGHATCTSTSEAAAARMAGGGES